ncbi:MAG: hypothetical protein ACR2MA_04470 [Egibacteraceae bacterium]
MAIAGLPVLSSTTLRFVDQETGSARERLDAARGAEASPEVLRGVPVWVVNAGKDTFVFVVAAILDDGVLGRPEPVLWCGAARAFVTRRGASVFDVNGDWLTGPAPHGLPMARASRLSGDQVMVDRPLQAAPRESNEGGRNFDACFTSNGLKPGVLPHPAVREQPAANR